MTTETMITDERLIEIAANELQEHFDRLPNSIFLFARAIKQAVLQFPEMQALKKDAERYRWLKENIMEQYNLPGSYYLPDDAPEVWDRTIDAAKEQT